MNMNFKGIRAEIIIVLLFIGIIVGGMIGLIIGYLI